MSDNPVNLLLRFLLELAGLTALGYWGWTQHDGAARWVWAIGAVAAAAAVWGVFRVPGDGGAPVVAVAGWVRLAIEAAFLTTATAALYASGQRTTAVVFAAVVIGHYLVSYDRVLRFLEAR
jgi:hypothetical protein